MAQVTFLTTVGGDGTTVSDDANPTTGLANGGHRTRFVPALAQVVAVAQNTVNEAVEAAASATQAETIKNQTQAIKDQAVIDTQAIANQAQTSANAAEASAQAAAALAAAFAGTSTSSVAIGLGNKTFTTQSGEQYTPGIWMTAVSQANAANFMFGQVVSYSGTTLVINVQSTGGSGTFADWNLSLAGVRGAPGTGITDQATGWTATGGTSPRTLTVDQSVSTSQLQPTLVSGTNIKTINGSSVLGGGDLVVGGGSLLRMTVFTSSGTWTKGVGTNFIRVYGVGGGGSGGGPRASTTSGAGGGGAGGYFQKFASTSGVTTATVTIGAAGAVQNTDGSNGNSGGNTTFVYGATTLTGNGGSGGFASFSGGRGGAGGTATNGDLNIGGQAGMGGRFPSGTNGLPGTGGSSMLGLGGPSNADQGVHAATGYGAGGTGASGGNAGGAGTSGVVVVEEYA